MSGKVKTREKCSVCGANFKFVESIGYVCCNSTPKSFYVYLYYNGDHRISRDRDGHILDSYKRAERLLETIRGEIDRGTFDPNIFIPKQAEAYRVKNLLTQWRIGKNHLSGWHKNKLDEYVRRFYVPIMGEVHVKDLNRHRIEQLYVALPEHLSLKTKKNIMDGFKNFVHWLNQMELITRVVSFPVISPPEPTIKWIDKNTQLSLLDKIPIRHRPIFSFLMHHPVRIGEACALQRKHFDLSRMIVIIEQAQGYNEIKSRKNKRAYVLPISSNWNTETLKAMLPDAFVFRSKHGLYTSGYLGEIWRGISPGINLYNATRHSIASQAINNGIPLERIGGALGHANSAMTRKYASMNVELLRDVVDGTTQILHIVKMAGK